MSDTLILDLPWPDDLDPTMVPFAGRTVTVLRQAGFYDDPTLFNKITEAEVAAWWNTGPKTIADLRTTAREAIPKHHAETGLRKRLPADLETVTAEPWAPHVWRHDPRFAEFLPRGDSTVYGIATNGTALDRRHLFNRLEGLRAAIDAQAVLKLSEAVAQYVEAVAGQHGARLEVLLARTGLNGQDPIIGEEAGRRLGVSQQRISQLVRQLNDHRDRSTPPIGIWMPQIDNAVHNGWPDGYTTAGVYTMTLFFAR